MRKLIILFSLIFINSCETPEQLIAQNRIYDGMTKAALWSAMVDVVIQDDITLAPCFRRHFPEIGYEIVSSTSMNIFYVFDRVTVPGTDSNCSRTGNGYLVYANNSYESSTNWITNRLNSLQVAENENNDPPKSNDSDEELIRYISNGSGFFINGEGYLVSNFHVINICQYVSTRIEGIQYDVNIISADTANDLMIGRITKTTDYLEISSDGAFLGEDIITAGFPFTDVLGNKIKITKGVVSSLSGADNYSLMQIDAAVQPGNSGGPILNSSGDIVGVVVSKLSSDALQEGDLPENINFGIKSENLGSFLKSNNIEFTRSKSNKRIESKEIASRAEQATVLLECYNSVANLRKIMNQGSKVRRLLIEY